MRARSHKNSVRQRRASARRSKSVMLVAGAMHTADARVVRICEPLLRGEVSSFAPHAHEALLGSGDLTPLLTGPTGSAESVCTQRQKLTIHCSCACGAVYERHRSLRRDCLYHSLLFLTQLQRVRSASCESDVIASATEEGLIFAFVQSKKCSLQ